MAKLLASINRNRSLLTGKKNLEHLYTFKNFPVFMGCVNQPMGKDLTADMTWDICKDTGLIQLRQLLPLKILYLDQHNDGTGQIWQNHYKAFAKFLHKYKPKNILEIGGAHDQIAQNYWQLGGKANWTTVEPNPQHIKSSKIRVIKGWFDDKFKLKSPVDTVIHSHVFEHTYEPFKFIEHIGKFLKKGDRHIFTFPNLTGMLKKKWTNTLNFEHTVFLTEEITDYILKKEGFKIIEKQYFGNPHSIFYATEKTEKPQNIKAIKNRYGQYKKLFMNYIDYHLEMIKKLNSLTKRDREPIYMFGAHIFSQTLIQFGLNTNKIVSILDNSPLKQGKRLYGTRFKIDSPKILKEKGLVNLILKAGSYNKEIKEDILKNINPKVKFW